MRAQGLAFFVGVFALCGAVASAHAVDESDLLPVDEAFALSAEARGADRVEVRWRIADGYYLYKHRMAVEPADAGVRAGTLQLPAGKPYEDEFFGKTETYRQQVTLTLPAIVGAGASLNLKIKYQGCADVGVCYPPQTRTLRVAMPVAEATAAGEGEADRGFAALSRTLGGGQPAVGGFAGANAAPLPEAQAFGFEAIADGGNRLLLRFSPAKGYYLYRDNTTLKLEADGIVLGTPRWPRGTAYHDAHFGDVIVYFEPIDVPIPLVRSRGEAQTVTLRATFQGCQDNGICYPPMTRQVRIALPAGRTASDQDVQAAAQAADAAAKAASARAALKPAGAPADAAADTTAAAAPAATIANGDAASAIAAGASENAAGGAADDAAAPVGSGRIGSLWLALLFALIGGVILNLMPCVLPVLSLKALSLAGSGENPQRARGHALWYTAGVLVSFLALGGLALALREAGTALGWGFQLQQPLVVAALALVMFGFGLSLSGLWHVGGAWTGVGHGLTGRSGPAGDFFTGALAVVVAAPCTAPFMVGALGWAFTAPIVPALLVFVFLGLGLALPFLLIGFVPALARRLPKPGAWMETLKQFLAFPMYLTAIWLLWVLTNLRGADAAGWLTIAALLLAFAAWAAKRARFDGMRWGRGAAFAAVLIALWPLWSIAKLPRPAADAQARGATQDLPVVPFSESRLAELRAQNRVVLVNMTADWCITCKANERTVFDRDGFREALRRTNATYMVGDWTDVDPAITAYLQRYRSVGVPLYVVYPRGGGEGRVLPTVLTPQIVRKALEDAAQRR